MSRVQASSVHCIRDLLKDKIGSSSFTVLAVSISSSRGDNDLTGSPGISSEADEADDVSGIGLGGDLSFALS